MLSDIANSCLLCVVNMGNEHGQFGIHCFLKFCCVDVPDLKEKFIVFNLC
jgi:hypothetical protein